MGVHNDSGIRKVRRRGRVRWVIDFLWSDREGREHRYRRDAHVQTREAALLEARELRDRVLRTGTLEKKSATPTFRQFVETTFTPIILPRFRPATRVRYLALFGQGLMDHFGPLRLDTIGSEAVFSFAATLARREVQSKGAVVLLKTVLRAATDLDVIATMPRVPRVWTESKKLPDAPTLEEIECLLKGARGWLVAAIALAAFAGLRSGEVRAIEVGDVDLVGGRIIVRRAFSEDEEETPKSGNERVVPIADVLRSVLDNALRAKLPKARIVVTNKGSTPSRQLILKRLNMLEDRLGMRRWTFHQLRHFFCSYLVAMGASLEAVRLLGGHSALAIMQRYVHASGAELASAVDRFNKRGGNR